MCHIVFVALVEDLIFISRGGTGGGWVTEENAAKPRFKTTFRNVKPLDIFEEAQRNFSK